MSRSHNLSPADGRALTTLRLIRGLPRFRRSTVLAAMLLALACLLVRVTDAATPPVLTPPEVRSAPAQFIVVAVNNPVSARPSAVGGTAHGYGGGSTYRVSASAAAVIRDLARQYSLTRVSEWP